MKLSKLLLQAFGPFTDTTLDFSASPVNLHLIYGPNEAGKSSALRAMTDLRFGIPTRSPDDFVHPFSQMRIAGIFHDEQGEAIGLVRRKGSKATLSRLDLSNLQPDPNQAVQTTHELALTGGLRRDEFEAMFGLNHARLREGGDLLLKGEGELGSALFEASAGIRGIAAILKELDDDAKKLHNPHGAAKTAVINEAKRQLDEQRQALRHAQTKPAEWHSLHRAHEQAKAALDDIDLALESQRRRENELTELRTVEPLLREHERTLIEWDALADAPDLPETAREERLSAEQALFHAEQQGLEAESEISRCAEALAGLHIEAALLKHAEAIERLAASIEPVARSRVEVRQQQAAIEQMQAELASVAARIGNADGSPAWESRLAQALPTAADRAELNHHLEAIAKLGERLAGYQQQARRVEQQLKKNSEDNASLPEPAVRRGLATALRQAQALGDVERQSGDWERQLREISSQLTQVLADIAVPSVEKLRDIRPVLDAEINTIRQELADIDQATRTLADEDGRLRRDLEEQRLRLRHTAAEGEVVTAETLRLARTRRDEHWQQVRRVYVEKSMAGEAGLSCADHFETVQTEADRQADLLRADAKRAAGFEECSARIGQMERRREDIAAERQALTAREASSRAAWTTRLEQAGLPSLSAEALQEWQGRRQEALHLAERLAAAQSEQGRLQAEIRLATSNLSAALQAAAYPAAEIAESLSALVEQAVAWDKSATAAQAKYEERVKAALDLAAEQDEINQGIATTTAELEGHQTRLQAWYGRLYLNPDSPPEAVQARLAELDALARQAAALADARLRLARSQAVIDEFTAQAWQLAELLGEPIPEQAEDFAERLRKRLHLSKEAELQRKNLERDRAKAESSQRKAIAERARQAEALARLCALAGVADSGQLPGQENLAAQKRSVCDALDRLRQQLRLASTRPEAELRQTLAGRDAISLDAERERCKAEIARLEQEQATARQTEEQTRRNLEAIDASDQAARAREAMESAAARYRAALRPWARLRLAHSLLSEALSRFRERAQAPMVAAASAYFALMTDGRYPRLVADDEDGKPVLRALRADGVRIGVEAMSEGTADQLYLALRLAALELRRASHPSMPLVLDDVLITSDDQRAANILRALARFAEQGQVMLFTHHRHLIELAGEVLGEGAMAVHRI